MKKRKKIFKHQIMEKRRKFLLNIFFSMFGEICWYCGISLKNKPKHFDHIIPRSRGGHDDMDNLALVCGFCNHAKYTSTLDCYLKWLAEIRSKKFTPKITVDGFHPTSRLYSDPSNEDTH